MESDIRQRHDPAESLAKPVDLKQHGSHQNSRTAASRAMVC
jgi:hypothetical protein